MIQRQDLRCNLGTFASFMDEHSKNCIEITPPKTNMEPEDTPLEKEGTFPNHQFLGSMLIFWGCILRRMNIAVPNRFNRWKQIVFPIVCYYAGTLYEKKYRCITVS